MEFRLIHLLMLSSMLFVSFGVGAREQDDEEIVGIVVDRTLTRSGREFYTRFSTIYNSLPEGAEFNIVVAEIPIPKLGTKLSISVNHDQIYVKYFGRKLTTGLGDDVSDSIRAVYDYINSSSLAEKSPDVDVSGY